MALTFNKLPPGTKIPPTPFQVNISAEKIQELQTLVKLSKLAPPTYEGLHQDRKYGITTEWLANAKEAWMGFNWKNTESHINSFPQFTYEIEDMTIHFVGVFSEREDAVPVLLLHGWPGSFLEFLPFFSLLRTTYTPSTLPCHFIVPSLPGYAFSSGPPLNKDFGTADSARVVDRIMANLGFDGVDGPGYVVQGGDIGARIARILGVDYPGCRAVHLNATFITKPPNISETSISETEKQRRQWFSTWGSAYMMEHATRASTIGNILSTNPVALLAWIGEKFLDWVDDPLPLDTILESVTLYWFTESLPRGIYHYRETLQPPKIPPAMDPRWYIRKPFGFSYFPEELMPAPKSWVETTGNLVFWRQHDKGGHFAALERPQDLVRDVVEFVELVSK